MRRGVLEHVGRLLQHSPHACRRLFPAKTPGPLHTVAEATGRILSLGMRYATGGALAAKPQTLEQNA